MNGKTNDVVSHAGAGVAVLFGYLSPETWIAILGFAASLISIGIGAYYRRLDNARRQQRHDLEMQILAEDRRKINRSVLNDRRLRDEPDTAGAT